MIGGGAAGLSAGLNSNSKLAAGALSIAGIGAGAGLSVLFFFIFALRSIILLVGAYLLINSFIIATGVWVVPNLIVGGILLFVGVIVMRSKSGNS